jgi:hypothetical protein
MQSASCAAIKQKESDLAASMQFLAEDRHKRACTWQQKTSCSLEQVVTLTTRTQYRDCPTLSECYMICLAFCQPCKQYVSKCCPVLCNLP